MENSQFKKSPVRENLTSTGKFSSYYVEISHKGLKEHKVIKSKELDILENKIRVQKEKWDEKWKILSQKKRGTKGQREKY